MQVIDFDKDNKIESVLDFKSKSKAVETARLWGKLFRLPIRMKSGNELRALR